MSSREVLFFKAARSRHIAPWVLWFAIIAFSACGYLVWAYAVVSFPRWFWAFFACAPVLFMSMILPLVRVRYELNDEEIRLRTGLAVTWRVQLTEISRIYERSGHLILDSNGVVRTIGCIDQGSLLEEIAQRAAHLRRYGNELRGEQHSTSST